MCFKSRTISTARAVALAKIVYFLHRLGCGGYTGNDTGTADNA